MSLLISFAIGVVAGGAAVAFLYGRTVAELDKLRQEIVGRAEGKKASQAPGAGGR